MYYNYHANALALGGKIRRPVEQVIESQAASSLPSSGGFGSSHVENFNFKNIVSFRVAHTEVAGSELVQNGLRIHTARSSAIVEGLSILDVVSADKVVARLASRHPANDDEPAIITTGSYFENLKIAGHAVEVVEFAHETFYSCDTHKKLGEAFQTRVAGKPPKAAEKEVGNGDALEEEPIHKQKVLDCHVGRWIANAKANDPHPALVEHLRQRYVQLQAAAQFPGTVTCSVVKEIALKPGSREIKVHGAVVVVPRFGTIILGELIVRYGMRRINMLRVELGSPDEGSMTAISGCLNGGGG